MLPTLKEAWNRYENTKSRCPKKLFDKCEKEAKKHYGVWYKYIYKLKQEMTL